MQYWWAYETSFNNIFYLFQNVLFWKKRFHKTVCNIDTNIYLTLPFFLDNCRGFFRNLTVKSKTCISLSFCSCRVAVSRLWFCRTLSRDQWVSWAFSQVRRSSCWRGLESGPAGVWSGPPNTRPLRRVWFPAAPCPCLTLAVVSTWTAFSHLGKVSHTHTNVHRLKHRSCVSFQWLH